MQDGAALLANIDKAYASRVAGDKAGVWEFMAPGATFCLPGAETIMTGAMAGPTDARSAIGKLMDEFEFHDLRRLDAVVDGRKAAVRLEVTLSRPGQAPVTTECLDFWTAGEDGKLTSLTEYVDTALLARLWA
jgi:ketosteroid isomerase-like protein